MRLPALALPAVALAVLVGACSLATSGLPDDAGASASSGTASTATTGSSASSTSAAGPGGATSSSTSSSSAGGLGGGGGGPGGAGGSGATGGTGGTGGAQGECGDDRLDPMEECDDGNVGSGDGCSSNCQVECVGTKVLKDPVTHHCYVLEDLVPLGWQLAEDACAVLGMHLVALSSAAERDAIVPLLDQCADDVWCGGNNLANENTFVWSSGDPWTYSDWDAAEPNGGTAENCARLTKSTGWKFRTTGCGDSRPYVCERKPAGS